MIIDYVLQPGIQLLFVLGLIGSVILLAKKIKMRIWDTFNANEYCNNCSFDKEKSRGRRVFGVYKCNGHEI